MLQQQNHHTRLHQNWPVEEWKDVGINGKNVQVYRFFFHLE